MSKLLPYLAIQTEWKLIHLDAQNKYRKPELDRPVYAELPQQWFPMKKGAQYSWICNKVSMDERTFWKYNSIWLKGSSKQNIRKIGRMCHVVFEVSPP